MEAGSETEGRDQFKGCAAGMKGGWAGIGTGQRYKYYLTYRRYVAEL